MSFQMKCHFFLLEMMFHMNCRSKFSNEQSLIEDVFSYEMFGVVCCRQELAYMTWMGHDPDESWTTKRRRNTNKVGWINRKWNKNIHKQTLKAKEQKEKKTKRILGFTNINKEGVKVPFEAFLKVHLSSIFTFFTFSN